MATVPKSPALVSPTPSKSEPSLPDYCQDVARRAKVAAGRMATLPAAIKISGVLYLVQVVVGMALGRAMSSGGMGMMQGGGFGLGSGGRKSRRARRQP